MEDAFDLGEEKKTRKKKSKNAKQWMICSIVLAAVLLVGGAFAGMIIIKGNRDTNRLSEVEQQVKEKDQKIADLESKISELEQKIKDAETANTAAGQKVDYVDLADMLRQKGTSINVMLSGITPDKEYYYVAGSIIDKNGFGGYEFYYKEAKEGAEWQLLYGGQGAPDCSKFTAEQKALIDKYFSAQAQLICH